MTFSDLLLAVLTLCLGAAVDGVMSKTNSCTDITHLQYFNTLYIWVYLF